MQSDLDPRDVPPDADAEPLDVAFAAYLRACDTGKQQDRQAFLAQFPDLADELAGLMEAADLLGQATRSDEMAETPIRRSRWHSAPRAIPVQRCLTCWATMCWNGSWAAAEWAWCIARSSSHCSERWRS